MKQIPKGESVAKIRQSGRTGVRAKERMPETMVNEAGFEFFKCQTKKNF